MTKDLAQTRALSENLLGRLLVATGCESDDLFGGLRTSGHGFLGRQDGGALAFFQLAGERDRKLLHATDPNGLTSHRTYR